MKIETGFDEFPPIYTCDGDDINPRILVSDVPPETKTLALIIDDPDATNGGTWLHWLMWNIPVGDIDENSAPGVQGNNSWGKPNYGGPCPPSGKHRYVFKVFALSASLDLPEGSSLEEFFAAIDGKVVEKEELVTFYQRREFV